MGQNISNMEAGFNAASEEAYEGYLKKHTLYAGESISGYILFEYKKGITLIPTFKINDMSYKFVFSKELNEKEKKKKKDTVKTENKKKTKKKDKK